MKIGALVPDPAKQVASRLVQKQSGLVPVFAKRWALEILYQVDAGVGGARAEVPLTLNMGALDA
jgi:hypothetical protein